MSARRYSKGADLDLVDHRRRDPRVHQRVDLRAAEVGDPDALDEAFGHSCLHERPRPGRPALRPVNEVEVDVVHTESLEAVHRLRLRVCASRVELGGQEDLLAWDRARADGASHARLVAIGLRRVDQAVSAVEGPTNGSLAVRAVGHLPDPETQLWDPRPRGECPGRLSALTLGLAHLLQPFLFDAALCAPRVRVGGSVERHTARESTLSKRSAMGRVASVLDNAAEAVNSILKTEYVYRHTFATREQACLGVGRWIDRFHNTRRRHSWCCGISPIDYERQHKINIAAQPAAESLCPCVRMRSSARHRRRPRCSLAHPSHRRGRSPCPRWRLHRSTRCSFPSFCARCFCD